MANGRQIAQMARDTFGTDKITQEQLDYILDMLRPSSYLLRNHRIKNKPMTFSVSGRNRDKERGHRPWQVDLVNDNHSNLAVIKSRQLGLSEIGLGKLLHFVDTNSYDAVKAMYAFPTIKQTNDFVKSRLNPLFDSGYYSTIINKDMDSIETKRIRDSFLYFRSSSKASAMEGVDIDYLALDE